MREIVGELWDYFDKPNTVVCITTNGSIKVNGQGVMGRGCALEAAKMFKFLPAMLGNHLRKNGNVFTIQTMRADETGLLAFFPVKRNWWEQADLELILRSAFALKEEALRASDHVFVLPRPGCGNGHRMWMDVKQILMKVDLPDNVWVISKGQDANANPER